MIKGEFSSSGWTSISSFSVLQPASASAASTMGKYRFNTLSRIRLLGATRTTCSVDIATI